MINKNKIVILGLIISISLASRYPVHACNPSKCVGDISYWYSQHNKRNVRRLVNSASALAIIVSLGALSVSVATDILIGFGTSKLKKEIQKLKQKTNLNEEDKSRLTKKLKLLKTLKIGRGGLRIMDTLFLLTACGGAISLVASILLKKVSE